MLFAKASNFIADLNNFTPETTADSMQSYNWNFQNHIYGSGELQVRGGYNKSLTLVCNHSYTANSELTNELAVGQSITKGLTYTAVVESRSASIDPTLLSDKTTAVVSLTATETADSSSADNTTVASSQNIADTSSVQDTSSTQDTTATQTTTNAATATNAQAASAAILNMSDEELQQLLVSSSGAVYSNMQLAATTQARSQSLDIAKVATGRYLQADNDLTYLCKRISRSCYLPLQRLSKRRV
ncbi:hypothetical protein [Psittacicella hinzii]|uniref:Uncharacterized protein n=1 Tax=Psittacicella hinzii TaxID=2028575 RepID=A0A3A1YHY4_9GAMM|nr:hypothetical protein [Psittacicella hinzii]RIY36818.1 hypothetical protein CKF58_05595 [Psittacicella hinzii]